MMKLVGWQLSYEEGKHYIRWPCEPGLERFSYITDNTEEQCIRRAFGYFMMGMR